MVYTTGPKVRVFIRRLYTDPDSGHVITADSKRRTDPPGNGIGVVLTTPTGHSIRSEPPPPPRSSPWAESSSFEVAFSLMLVAS